jgi:predicted transcriptional regulator
MSTDTAELLAILELTEYETEALETLLMVGKTSAPDLAAATGIPKARIYGVLESLGNAGFIEIIPGRPKMYQPKPPAEILDRAIETRRQAFEEYEHTIDDHRSEFIDTLRPLYTSARSEASPTENLFHVVDVGDPSEEETRTLYREATSQIDIITKSFEYFETVEPTLSDVAGDCPIRVLFLDPTHLSTTNQEIQAEIVAHIQETYPSIETRFSTNPLPWRGTITDPSMEYDRGAAIMLVEEHDIPLHKRQAAVTTNGSFVAGLERYFELIWTYESTERYPASG